MGYGGDCGTTTQERGLCHCEGGAGRWNGHGWCALAGATGGGCQNLVLKSEILSKRFGKSRDKFWGSGYSALKGNPSGSDRPIVEGVGPKMQPAGMQAVPFGGLS